MSFGSDTRSADTASMFFSGRLPLKRPHAADWEVLEIGNFGPHEAVDPSLGSQDAGE